MSQHMEALARANEIRFARSKIKRQIAAGEITVQQILADPPPAVATMVLADLLLAQHRWGNQRVRRFCRSLVLSELRPVGGLTPRERERIVEQLRYVVPMDVEWVDAA